jgi:hypothetical protein
MRKTSSKYYLLPYFTRQLKNHDQVVYKDADMYFSSDLLARKETLGFLRVNNTTNLT